MLPVYQPIVDIQNGEILGFEANVKGVNKKGNEKGFEALRELEKEKNRKKKRRKLSLDFRARDLAIEKFQYKDEYKLFVNISPEEMEPPFFYEDVNIKNVVLEITEESEIKIAERLKNRLHELREKGLQVALDDFGTKNQNHDKRKVFEPDFVKIDKSFANEEDLIHFLSLKSDYKVIVEGVETAEQLQKCIELDFQYVQGYYFSKPLTYEELSDKLDSKELEQDIQDKLNFEPSV